MKGEWGRWLRATYSRGDALIKAGSKGIEEGREGLLGTVTGGVFGPSLKTTGRWGPPVSEVKGRERVPIRLGGFLGCGLDSLLGRSLSPGSKTFLFGLLLFSFLILDFCLSFEIVLLFRFERKPSCPHLVF
jgi:hypothetical protein